MSNSRKNQEEAWIRLTENICNVGFLVHNTAKAQVGVDQPFNIKQLLEASPQTDINLSLNQTFLREMDRMTLALGITPEDFLKFLLIVALNNIFDSIQGAFAEDNDEVVEGETIQ